MERHVVALFGEAEKGEYQRPYLCKTLEQLEAQLGNPPSESQGLYFAVQALLYHHPILFFRVNEEGFSKEDYFSGIHTLKTQKVVPHLSAFCLPGVGDVDLIDAVTPLCHQHQSVLITCSSDLYDYLTSISL